MIRLAKKEDIPHLLEIYAAARAFMRQNGNPTQWSSTYPSREDLAADIDAQQLYAVENPEGRIWACFVMADGPDATYDVIYDGAWTKDAPYGVLHRVAGDGTEKGLVKRCVSYAAGQYAYLRIDTHENNLPMQRALSKEGFTCRGTIITIDGTKRLAYDRFTEE